MGRIVFSNTISKVKGTMKVGNQLRGSPGVGDTDLREDISSEGEERMLCLSVGGTWW